MVNGRTLEEETKRTNEIFYNMSLYSIINEELDEMILVNGCQHLEEKRVSKLILMKLFNKETKGEWILIAVNLLCMILTYMFLPVSRPIKILSLVIYIFNFLFIGFFLKESYKYFKTGK